MDILASYTWLKEYVKTDLAPDAFAREVSLRSMSVEKVEDLSARFAHIVVGLVNEVRLHPNADRLRIVTVNIGAETTEVVCGGTNVVAGMKVCVALPGSRVRWHGEGDPITLDVTEIRGVKSVGMICAPAEVGFPELGTGEREIWDLSHLPVKAGTPLAEALGMDDTLFTIEITTNRPDAKGMVGLAREAAAATGGKFAWSPPSLPTGTNEIPFSVHIDDTARCLRQMAVVIDDVTVAPSPWWLQARLLLAGVRPINNIVDITNYVMLEYAQPLHAFDYKAIEGAEIRVRAGKTGEKLMLLNGKEYDVSGVLVLADSAKALDIAGIMGGEHTGTTASTRAVVLSASAFDPVALRRASRALNLQSDAQLLFEKGLSTEALAFTLARAAQLILEIAGGHVASNVCDVRVAPYQPIELPIDFAAISKRIGVQIPDARINEILEQLGFTIEKRDAGMFCVVPWWRDHDIEESVDFCEEVARIYGYHEMPSVLPTGAPPITMEDPTLTWERWLKFMLDAAGYDEFFSYSFTSADDLTRYGEDPSRAYAVLNPLSADQSHMRTSLMPSILRAIEGNQGHTQAGNWFELSRVYIRREHDIPDERMHLAFGEYGYDDAEATFMRLRGTLELLAAKSGLSVQVVRDDADTRWHPTRAARIDCAGKTVGHIGEVASAVQTAFGIDRRVMAVMLDMEALFPMMQITHRYVPVPEYPSITRDISFRLGEQVPFSDLRSAIAAADSAIVRVEFKDVYRGAGVQAGEKSLTVSVTMAAPDRTLTSAEADAMLEKIVQALLKRGILEP